MKSKIILSTLLVAGFTTLFALQVKAVNSVGTSTTGPISTRFTPTPTKNPITFSSGFTPTPSVQAGKSVK